MIVLFIDATSNKEVRVGLRINGKNHVIRRKLDFQRAQVVLPLIDEILREKNIKLKDLNSIEVNTGAGSFTGIRVGLSVANALGLSLGIPVLPAGRHGKKVIY